LLVLLRLPLWCWGLECKRSGALERGGRESWGVDRGSLKRLELGH